jgi:hypothetical protein
MTWKCSVTAIPIALIFAGAMAGCNQSSSRDAGNVAEERHEASVSQGKQVEEVRRAFLDFQRLFRKRDVAGIVSAFDVEFYAQRKGRPAEGALQALRGEYEGYSDRLFETIANARIGKVEIAPEELRAFIEGDSGEDTFLVHAGDSAVWLFHDTPEGWKTLGHDYEGEIAEMVEELGRRNRSR